MINSPVLLIAYNRPDTTRMVFERIRMAQPKQLYFAVDAPKDMISAGGGYCANNQLVKQIINDVDWECDIHTRFAEKNQGCGFGPANAISWAFESCDRLIVLEDDCVPELSFFQFCDEMLERYYDDKRISIVSGRSHHAGSKFFENQDYIFTRYAHTWGWATWKRCWDEYDIYASDSSDFLKNGGGYNFFLTDDEAKSFNNGIEALSKRIDIEVTHSWDSQWYYTRLKNGALGIVPSKNLIKNVGNGNGTHTSASFKEIATGELSFPLKHPKYITVNKEYEQLHFKTHIKVETNILKRVIKKLYNKLK